MKGVETSIIPLRETPNNGGIGVGLVAEA
jgi:hypothetical protein